MSENSATNLCPSEDPKSSSAAQTQGFEKKNHPLGAKTEKVTRVLLGAPFWAPLSLSYSDMHVKMFVNAAAKFFMNAVAKTRTARACSTCKHR